MLSYISLLSKISVIQTRLNNYIVDEQLVEKKILKENISIAFSKTGSQIESHTIFFMTWIKNWKTQLQNW